ncbi:FUSC family protein [Brachybacterium endophyticum]|uniref:FUSC family protein n=1 Tax=Brachybacterium endophyticum TaxID=2182385 RepID=UPI001F0BEF3C|nr:FUSC family protein [Brachybacterium endophyticum]
MRSSAPDPDPDPDPRSLGPHLASIGRSMVTIGPRRADLAPAVRIAASLAAPLVILLLTGHVQWSLFASFGAFTSIYARYVPTATRLRHHATVGLLLTICVGVGALIAQLAAAGVLGGAVHLGLTTVIGALAAAIGSVIVMSRGMRPTGAVFPVFATTAVASAPSVAPFWLALLIAGASALWCVVLGFLARWTGEANPDAALPETVGITGAMRRQEFSRYGFAALVSGIIAAATGIPSPYWAQVAAVVPLSAPGRRLQVERGLHRIVGTALGVGVTAFLLSFPSQPWQLLVWVILFQFLAEMFVLRNYSLALVFITPLALLMVQLANPRPVGALLAARVSETAIGAVVGIGSVLLAVALERRRRSRD